jgi:hypothetical protein
MRRIRTCQDYKIPEGAALRLGSVAKIKHVAGQIGAYVQRRRCRASCIDRRPARSEQADAGPVRRLAQRSRYGKVPGPNRTA